MGMEDASNDETAIISELLNSAEGIQSLVNTKSNKLLQKNELLSLDNNKSNIEILPLTQFDNDNGESIQNSQREDIEKVSKLQNIRHVHIPYILNGELYQIQTQDGENVTVKCCHCPPDRVYRGSVRSTGNFHMHIKVGSSIIKIYITSKFSYSL